MKKYSFQVFLFLIIINFYINYNRLLDVSSDYIYWANLIFWLHTIPILHYFISGYKKEIFPFIGILGLLLMFSYSLPLYFIRPTSYQLGKLTTESMEWSFYGYGFFYIFYYLFQNLNFFKVKPFDPIKTDISSLKIRHSAFVFLSFWFIDKFLIGGTSMHHLAIIGIYIYLGTYIVLLNLKIKVSALERYLFYFVLAYEYILRLFDGLMVLIALLTLFLILIDYYSSRKLGRVPLLFIPFVISFAVISPIKSEFREIVWFSDKAFSSIERLEVISELYIDYLEGKNVQTNRSEIDDDKSNFFWRYSYQASALSMAMELTPSQVPFWEGESYAVISKFIPRFLWPKKPKEDMGYKFGTRYSIIDASNTNTSMNTPILTEMYINFGKLGILFGMMVLALVYVFLNNYLNSNTTSNIGKVYSISMLFPFVMHESNFTLAFGNIPLLIFSILIISKIYINKK